MAERRRLTITLDHDVSDWLLEMSEESGTPQQKLINSMLGEILRDDQAQERATRKAASK